MNHYLAIAIPDKFPRHWWADRLAAYAARWPGRIPRCGYIRNATAHARIAQAGDPPVALIELPIVPIGVLWLPIPEGDSHNG